MPDLAIIAFDLAAIATLTAGVYLRRHRRMDMAVAYVGVNIAVMVLTVALSAMGTAVGLGLGLGLFGVLSIVRLRSDELGHPEVAHYFAALTLGLLCGFQPEPPWLAPVLGSLLVAAMAAVDHPRLHARHRRQVVTVDRAVTDERELRELLSRLLGADVQAMTVTHVDLVRDLTVVDVRFRLAPAPGAGPGEVVAAGHPRPLAQVVG